MKDQSDRKQDLRPVRQQLSDIYANMFRWKGRRPVAPVGISGSTHMPSIEWVLRFAVRKEKDGLQVLTAPVGVDRLEASRASRRRAWETIHETRLDFKARRPYRVK